MLNTKHSFTEEERRNRAGKTFGSNKATSKELRKLQPLFISKTREDFLEYCKENKKSYTYYYKYSELLTFAKEVKPTQKKTELRESCELKSLIENLIKEVQELKEEVKALREEKPREEPPVTTDAVSDSVDVEEIKKENHKMLADFKWE